MSPRASRSGYPAIVTAVTGQWARLLAAVDALGPDEWSTPTRLGWSTAELVVHLTGNVQYLLEALADQQPGKRPDTPAVTYYDDVLDDAQEISERARRRQWRGQITGRIAAAHARGDERRPARARRAAGCRHRRPPAGSHLLDSRTS